VIAERKLQFPWGAWLKGGSQDGSEASEQTGACKGGCNSGDHKHTGAGREGSLPAGDVGQEDDQDQVSAAFPCSCYARDKAARPTTMCLTSSGVLTSCFAHAAAVCTAEGPLSLVLRAEQSYSWVTCTVKAAVLLEPDSSM